MQPNWQNRTIKRFSMRPRSPHLPHVITPSPDLAGNTILIALVLIALGFAVGFVVGWAF